MYDNDIYPISVSFSFDIKRVVINYLFNLDHNLHNIDELALINTYTSPRIYLSLELTRAQLQ